MQTKLTQFFKKNTLDKPSTFFEKNENIIKKKICLINENNIIKKDSKNEKKTLTIYTDGACKNNGKYGAINIAPKSESETEKEMLHTTPL